jgi:hypothetical protein
MIDFEGAKQIVAERELRRFDRSPAGPYVVFDDECVEYEWGWRIVYGPSRPGMLSRHKRNRRFHVVVDRVTGRLQIVGSAGMRIAVIHMLECRDAANRSPDISEEDIGGLANVTISMRLFVPLKELRERGAEPFESFEFMRLSQPRSDTDVDPL